MSKFTRAEIYFFLILLGSLGLDAQELDSLQAANRKLMWHDFFSGQAINGVNIGVVNSCILDSYSIGAEIKKYSSFWGASGSSLHGNYRYIFKSSDSPLPSSVITAGVHYLFLGLDTNLYVGNDITGWYLTPKVGIDMGFLGFFYGYNLPIMKDEFIKNQHLLELKYHLNLEAIKHFKQRSQLQN